MVAGVQHESHTSAAAAARSSLRGPVEPPPAAASRRLRLPPPAAVAALPPRPAAAVVGRPLPGRPDRGPAVPGAVPRSAVGRRRPTRLPRRARVRPRRRRRLPRQRVAAPRETGVRRARLSAVRVSVTGGRIPSTTAGAAVQQRVVQRTRRHDGVSDTTWSEPTRGSR